MLLFICSFVRIKCTAISRGFMIQFQCTHTQTHTKFITQRLKMGLSITKWPFRILTTLSTFLSSQCLSAFYSMAPGYDDARCSHQISNKNKNNNNKTLKCALIKRASNVILTICPLAEIHTHTTLLRSMHPSIHSNWQSESQF